MKITTFDPLIVSKKADDAVSFFEKIGFERTHNPTTETAIGEVSSVRLKHPDGGYHVDISDIASVPTDMTYIRMNVDDFDAAYAILEKHGFTDLRGKDNTLESGHAKEATMVAPSGYRIALVQHIKD